MKRLILNLTLLLALVLVPAVAINGTAAAADAPTCGTPSDAKSQVLKGISETGSDCDDSGVPNIVAAVVKLLSFVVGVGAVLMIIAAGYKYITSGGEASKVSDAKNSLIYALVGIIVAVLAQFLVRLVIEQANNSANSCPTGQHRSADDTCVKTAKAKSK